MNELVWSPASLRDLRAIREYISADSSLYADLVLRRIVAAVEQLVAHPESGRMVPERGDPVLRELIVAPYRVVYRTRGQLIEIVAVFRSSRQFPDVT